MWLITSIGFFSIVQKPGDSEDGMLTIRARAKGDMDALREKYLPTLGTTISNAGTDYRYRARAPREDIAKAMMKIVQDIQYGNFKNDVQKRQGSARAKTYHGVWDVLYGISEPGAMNSPREGVLR